MEVAGRYKHMKVPEVAGVLYTLYTPALKCDAAVLSRHTPPPNPLNFDI